MSASSASEHKLPYHSYLMRLWAADDQGKVVWRASLENPHTGERLGFTSLERMFAFLQDQTVAFSEEWEQRPSLK